MEFFDKKEEVMELHLTQYGKLLLSKGKLRPYYYAFYDDGVIYDSQHAGFEEDQNQVEQRIKSETTRMKTQNMVFGSETKINEHNKLVAQGIASHYRDYEILPDPNERDNFLKYPLYSMPFYSGQSTPTLEAVTDSPLFLTGSEITYFTGSNVNLPIPQAEAEVVYTLTRTHSPEGFVRTREDSRLSEAEKAKRLLAYGTQDLLGNRVALLSGDQIDITGRGMFLEFFEAVEGTDMALDDYELEIFEIQESETTICPPEKIKETILIPLRFESNPSSVDELSVQHYFNITTDDDVPSTYHRRNRGPRGKLFNRKRESSDSAPLAYGNIYETTNFVDDMDCSKDSTDEPGGDY